LPQDLVLASELLVLLLTGLVAERTAAHVAGEQKAKEGGMVSTEGPIKY